MDDYAKQLRSGAAQKAYDAAQRPPGELDWLTGGGRSGTQQVRHPRNPGSLQAQDGCAAEKPRMSKLNELEAAIAELFDRVDAITDTGANLALQALELADRTVGPRPPEPANTLGGTAPDEPAPPSDEAILDRLAARVGAVHRRLNVLVRNQRATREELTRLSQELGL